MLARLDEFADTTSPDSCGMDHPGPGLVKIASMHNLFGDTSHIPVLFRIPNPG
jgi:hypothetical protein